jgi:ribose-phosphate pyrophosphokinase
VTAIVPYFGYARQDRRTTGRRALGARVIADMLHATAIQRLVLVDLHTPAVEGFFSMRVEHLTAVPILAAALRAVDHEDSIVVAPDLGAVKLAEHYAELLDRPLAIIHKTRVSAQQVAVKQIIGDVVDRSPIIVDDMLSTGGTIEAALKALLAAGCREDATVAISHGLFVERAEQLLQSLPIRRILTTDSVTQHLGRLPIEVQSLGELLADAIRHLHDNESLHDVESRAQNRRGMSPTRVHG